MVNAGDNGEDLNDNRSIEERENLCQKMEERFTGINTKSKHLDRL